MWGRITSFFNPRKNSDVKPHVTNASPPTPDVSITAPPRSSNTRRTTSTYGNKRQKLEKIMANIQKIRAADKTSMPSNAPHLRRASTALPPPVSDFLWTPSASTDSRRTSTPGDKRQKLEKLLTSIEKIRAAEKTTMPTKAQHLRVTPPARAVWTDRASKMLPKTMITSSTARSTPQHSSLGRRTSTGPRSRSSDGIP